jgi:hypothetical protein
VLLHHRRQCGSHVSLSSRATAWLFRTCPS